ncbi:MAG: carbon storage regulator [Thermoguttaceae bacterium]|nr:carbon storage regulator [Thermoguttaceae bacterium]
MLVLSRKTGEKIAIGDQIEISIIQISPTTVRLGINAPKSCTIVRGELIPPPDIQDVVLTEGPSAEDMSAPSK